MNKSEQYEKWFNRHNEDWLTGAYGHTDYDYPVGQHRLRILLKAIENEEITGKKVLDIGCGGGDISFVLADKGADVIGIDMSDNMLNEANHRKNAKYTNLKGTVDFKKENVLELSEKIAQKKFDYIIAFGLIGYLESDDRFFKIVKELSHEGTVLFLSCRNELFNMTSISENTITEINQGNAIKLIDEIDKYYEKELPEEKSQQFLQELGESLTLVSQLPSLPVGRELDIDEKAMLSFARQSTPENLKNTAAEYSYKFCRYWGVHPHLLLPRLNKKLPPQVFNILSDALCVFEDEDISLIWSSVFIGKFIFTS